MFAPQDARSQRFGVVIVAHRYLCLDHDWTVIQLGSHEMHGTAVQLHSRLQCSWVGIEARERGKKRRMDVEHPAGIALDESRREDAHEASKRDETWRKPIDFPGEERFERLAAGEGAVLDDAGRDAMRGGYLEALCVRAVADHGGHRQSGVDQ